jgi:hypothetical protein
MVQARTPNAEQTAEDGKNDKRCRARSRDVYVDDGFLQDVGEK